MLKRNVPEDPQIFCYETNPGARMSYEVVKITPQLAAKWLETLAEVEVIRFDKSRALKFAIDMKNNLWRLTSKSRIVFDDNGILIEGKHRLHAVILAQKSVAMVVLRGGERDLLWLNNKGVGV